MKKMLRLLPVTLLTLSITAAYSQVVAPSDTAKSADELAMTQDYATGIYFGFEFLPTFTNFQIHQLNGDLFDTRAEVGYGFEAHVGYDFFEHFAFQGGLLFSALGQKYTDERNVERNIHLNYVSVPLMVVFNTDNTKLVNLNVAAGPQVGFLVASKFDGNDNVQTDSIKAVFGTRTGDFGIAYGAGIDFRLSKLISIGAGFRGVIGLLDISDKSLSKEANEYYILDRSHVITYAGYAGIQFKL